LKKLIFQSKELLDAYKKGQLGQTKMPEDSHPKKMSTEERLTYFTLPMALNYQRDSYKLWESAKKTFEDKETRDVFDIKKVSKMNEDLLRKKLTKYKLAMQPNKHIHTWKTIATTIYENFESFQNLFEKCDKDFLKLKKIIQQDFKKGFPYLSGPKIFNYWSWIIQEYGKQKLKSSEFIEIAPDTHITQCSVKLEIITSSEAEKISKEEISSRWRTALKGSGITPIQMHAPLWFWSRNGFIYKIKNK
jgi:hypothetical protein